MSANDFDPTKLTQAHRIAGAVVGFAFAAIGIILIGWFWLQPFGFMNPPVIFRLVGTMIAIVFVAVGGTAGMTALKGGSAVTKALTHRMGQLQGRDQPLDRGIAGYKCPNCGASLADDADVSPSGDAKCAYCRTWFNIHG
jgi:hypothetical protein